MTDSIITSNYNEVLGVGNPNAQVTSEYLEVIGVMPIGEILTTVKHEVLYGSTSNTAGVANSTVTSSKLEVLFAGKTNSALTTTKHEVLYGSTSGTILTATKVEAIYGWSHTFPRRTIVFINKTP